MQPDQFLHSQIYLRCSICHLRVVPISGVSFGNAVNRENPVELWQDNFELCQSNEHWGLLLEKRLRIIPRKVNRLHLSLGPSEAELSQDFLAVHDRLTDIIMAVSKTPSWRGLEEVAGLEFPEFEFWQSWIHFRHAPVQKRVPLLLNAVGWAWSPRKGDHGSKGTAKPEAGLSHSTVGFAGLHFNPGFTDSVKIE